MPTYVYQCEKCQHEFEVFQSMTEAPLRICPKDKCGQKTWGKGRVKRLIGAGAGLIFKGSGFYITDYRSENYRSAAQKEAQPKNGSAAEKKTGSTEKSGAATTTSSSGTSGGAGQKESS